MSKLHVHEISHTNWLDIVRSLSKNFRADTQSTTLLVHGKYVSKIKEIAKTLFLFETERPDQEFGHYYKAQYVLSVGEPTPRHSVLELLKKSPGFSYLRGSSLHDFT